jgi:hypothetical protein
LALRVLHPGVPETSFALIDQFITSSIGGTVNDEYLIRGQHYYAQLLSAGSVPGGQTVVIEMAPRRTTRHLSPLWKSTPNPTSTGL